jgi:23S rRNA (uracil1939-C5)-methyltransferase
MSIGEIVTLEIEGIAAGGAGVGRSDGRACFVELTAPGDRVVARVREEKPSWIAADLVEIERPSNERVAPPCPYFGSCGGCLLQHLDYPAQLREKKRALADSFSRIGRFASIPEIDTIDSPPYEYRNRMQFHRVARKARNPGASPVGLKGRNGEDVVPIRDCPVADPAIREALAAGTLAAPAWTDRFNVYARGATFLAEGSGAERGETEIFGRSLKLDVKGFFQSNGAVLDPLVRRIVELADESGGSGRAIDLYCGIGTFGAFLAERFSRLDLVERDKTALALARENVKGGGVRHFALSDDDWARRTESREGPYDFAVVDPPRVGLSATLRSWLVERPARTLVYVSCDAATLARDAKELAAGGYGLRSLAFLDFYPQTAHLESLAVFAGPR